LWSSPRTYFKGESLQKLKTPAAQFAPLLPQAIVSRFRSLANSRPPPQRSPGSNQSASDCPLAPVLTPTKRIFEVCKFRSRSRQEIHADDVEAHLRFSFARQLAHVLSRQAAQHVSFMCVDRGLGWRHIMRRPRLHLDETKQRSLPCNQIQIAGQISARPSMRHHNEVFALQVRTSGILAFDSCK